MRFHVALLLLAAVAIGCAVSAKNQTYFGKVATPAANELRYVTGSEPESLDPQIGTGQPEARIYMALFEGLTEYDPKTMAPIPAIAETWHVNNDSSEYVFHLRHNARWSNGDPITAQDFVYSFRRGVSPELAARNAYLAYYIKNAQPYNEGSVFVRDPATGQFLLDRDFQDEAAGAQAVTAANEYPAGADENQLPETDFHKYMHSPARLTLPADAKAQKKALDANAKLKAAVEGKEFVPVTAEDVGVEAIDDYTLRVMLIQPAPFFIKLFPHQFFRAVPRKAIEQWHEAWTQPEHIVTCGAFKLESWKPYQDLTVVRDPMYWDAANVHLDRIHFYPLDDNPTIMNLYKAGQVDAVLNHSVPAAWLDMIMPLRDYMDSPEVSIDYYEINTRIPPMNDIRVRKAFNVAIDKVSFAKWRKIIKPLTAFTPEGIFPGYPQPRGDQFDPARARQLLAEAGYPVTKNGDGSYSCPKFPASEVEILYNTQESNKVVAEFIQAQWKQNLGITVQLRNMEWKTFLSTRARGEFKGFARSGWVGDYMDPFTFLNIFYTKSGDNGTGWWDAKYVKMLDDANRELDQQKRYELLAKAEAFLMENQPMIPLDTAAVNWMKKPYVKGMYPNPGTLHPWKFVYIERDQSKWDNGTPNLAD
ncbi:MAG TPA: peptide ABC transporter substrate-binding protein [Pyrinomonadaceae bacterium]|nr:peptide ABC transporter substrate-binding protein [Pyrinomonadaceae bacterium]